MMFGAFSMNAQTKNQIKFTAKIANRNSDTLVIRGANNFIKVIPINKKEVFAATIRLNRWTPSLNPILSSYEW